MQKNKKTIIFFAIVAIAAILVVCLVVFTDTTKLLLDLITQSSQGTSLQCRDHIDNDGNGYCDYSTKGGYCKDGSILGDPNCQARDSETSACVSSQEKCDGIDNDCDGKTDEEITKTRDCGTNVGECEFGKEASQCSDGQWSPWGACIGGTIPVMEQCGDGKDNNCDGKTDEGC